MTVVLDPSVPLTNVRRERFANFAASGMTYMDSYLASGDPKDATPTAGRKTNASKMANRPEVAARIEWLREQNAKLAAPVDALNKAAIADLMEECTNSLMQAARSATTAGFESTARSLRKTITVHAGRSVRTSARVGPIESKTPDVDTEAMAARLYLCNCGAQHG